MLCGVSRTAIAGFSAKPECMVFDSRSRAEYVHDVEQIDEDYSEIEQNQR
jgi:hypothetical protein